MLQKVANLFSNFSGRHVTFQPNAFSIIIINNNNNNGFRVRFDVRRRHRGQQGAVAYIADQVIILRPDSF